MDNQQRNLFDLEPPPWELDDVADRPLATVVFPERPAGEFDYEIPDAFLDQLKPGCRVRVPLGRGNRAVVGFCVRVHQGKANSKTKSIRGVVDDVPLISPSILDLTRWMSDYYLCPWGPVLEAVVPAGVRARAGTRERTYLTVPTSVAARITQLQLPKRQAEVLRWLLASSEPMTVSAAAQALGCTTSPINALRKKKLVHEEIRRVYENDYGEEPLPRAEAWPLHDDQHQALAVIKEALNSRQHQTILLHGITGSGKTEVYIQAVQEVTTYGRQAIVLVPEISLTPQTRRRFQSRLDSVAVLHSNLTPPERHWHWQRIARGEVQVVVGARSAIFAPIPHLGLIIMDEEHEPSFKQESAPRYHARDVALRRAMGENCPLVLGSATPSLESWHQAQSGAYRLIQMPRRVNDLPLPVVRTIDMRDEIHRQRSRGSISQPLHQAMEMALRGGGQVILLLNRRGFSTHVQCPACGEVLRCENCDISLTHHKDKDKLICHYCSFQRRPPDVCPKCQFDAIRFGGLGTQRLEAEVQARFSGVSCLRMDSDTMQRPGSHEEALDRFRLGEVRILLGTQMIAKGLDFPNVTLVGVVNADTGLHLPDFRAGERTFQLVTQVAGRTGRGEAGGEVLVQTYNPEHASIAAAVHHDYVRFADGEMPLREQFGYPPFAAVVRMVFRGPTESTVEQFATAAAEILRARMEADPSDIRISGPGPAPLAKLRGNYRYHLLLRGREAKSINRVVAAATDQLPRIKEVQWIVDVDAVSML